MKEEFRTDEAKLFLIFLECAKIRDTPLDSQGGRGGGGLWNFQKKNSPILTEITLPLHRFIMKFF